MRKVMFSTDRNIEEFNIASDKVIDGDVEVLRLYDKYYAKFVSAKTMIVLVEWIDDEMYVEGIKLSEMVDGAENNKYYGRCLAVVIELYRKVTEAKEVKIGGKRSGDSSRNVVFATNGWVDLDKCQYGDPVNKNRRYNKITDEWEVRGHIRRYKSGKEIFVRGYKKSRS